MKRTLIKTIVLTLFACAVVFVVFNGCEKRGETGTTPGETGSTPTETTTTGVDRTAPPEPIVAPQPEEPPPPPAPPPPKLIYRIYPDENKPDEFVDLVEFHTVCDQPIGNLFGTGYLTINPTLPQERKIPLDRVVGIEFNKRGLVKHKIKRVSKVFDPVGYRESTVILRNPDETIVGDQEEETPVIIVLCRDLEGKLVDGAYWSHELRHEKSKVFYKIELVRE